MPVRKTRFLPRKRVNRWWTAGCLAVAVTSVAVLAGPPAVRAAGPVAPAGEKATTEPRLAVLPGIRRDSLPDSARSVILVNDTIQVGLHLHPEEIGLMEIVNGDSSRPATRNLRMIRIYTKEFIRQHPERFSDVPEAQADTLRGGKP